MIAKKDMLRDESFHFEYPMFQLEANIDEVQKPGCSMQRCYFLH